MTFDHIIYYTYIDSLNDHLAINLSWKYFSCKMVSTALFRMSNRKMVILHWGASLSTIGYLCHYIQILSKCVISKARFQYKNNLKTLSLTF